MKFTEGRRVLRVLVQFAARGLVNRQLDCEAGIVPLGVYCTLAFGFLWHHASDIGLDLLECIYLRGIIEV